VTVVSYPEWKIAWGYDIYASTEATTVSVLVGAPVFQCRTHLFTSVSTNDHREGVLAVQVALYPSLYSATIVLMTVSFIFLILCALL